MKYEIAISFAGENRDIAEFLNDQLQAAGVSIFYDSAYQSVLWGKSLSEELRNVYFKESKYCLMIVSKDYLSKEWPSHERKAAMSRMVLEKQEYILPYILDDTKPEEIPGFPPDIHYIHFASTTPRQLVEIILTKLKKSNERLVKFRYEEYGQFLIKQIHRRLHPEPSDSIFSEPYRFKLFSDLLGYCNVLKGTDDAKNLAYIFGTVMNGLLDLNFIKVKVRGEPGDLYDLTFDGYDLYKKLSEKSFSVFDGYEFNEKP